MLLRNTANIFPLSITTYGVLYIIFGLVLFSSFAWVAVGHLIELQQETRQRNLELARQELQDTLALVIKESGKIAKSFSEWGETVQQLGNSTYYSYWREYRVPSASFVPAYLRSVEIYNNNGTIIAPPGNKDMPSNISFPITPVTLIKQQRKDNLYYTHPLVYDQETNEVAGYILLQVDFIKAVTELQRFKYIDLSKLSVEVEEAMVITENDILSHLQTNQIQNSEFNRLQILMYETISQFFLVGISLASILLYLLIKLFGLPARRLSHHIDALRRGDAGVLKDSYTYKLAVAEFEKVRLSLNNYQTQLDSRDAALRDSELRKRAVLENVVDGIITVDEQGLIESSNPAINRIFELDNSDISGRNIISLFSESCRQDYITYFEHITQGKANPDQSDNACELIGMRATKSEFPIEIALSRMHIAGKQLFIVVVRDITDRKRTEERLVYLANFDELTGLPNRTLFRDRLHQAIAHAKRENRIVAVIFFDLDHFKKINDTFGHHVGDQLLVGAASRLIQSVREFDTVARLGGDEFTVILESINHEGEVADIVTQLLDTLEKPFVLEGQEAFIAASAGISVYPNDDVDIDNLVKNADTAMFRAKEMGGNSYQYFKADMNAKAVERLKLESALRYALEREEFELYYQPRVDLNTGFVIGMEALMRWHNPELGTIPPGVFIPLLEETGLILPVGDWVLKTACEQTRRWHKIGYSELKVSVNLSVRQFRQKNLVDGFQAIWESCDFNPANLELEITEGMLVENMDTTVDILSAFHQKGVQISIDDFGTGYSSLSYLKRFPINTLKIDRSFVRDLTENPDDAVITSAIVALARSLHLNVIAEGVETKPQLEYLHSLDCDEVQGFYFSKPLPVDEFEAFLEKQQSPTLRSAIHPIRLNN